jgi:predicted kinase
VALDYGLWRRRDRDAYKRLIEAHDGTWRLLYLKADRDLLLQRLADRRGRADANAMPLTPSDLEDFITRFEEPTGEGEELVEL